MKTILFSLSLFIIGFIACSENPSGSETGDILSQFQGENYTLITSRQMFGGILKSNSGKNSEPFEILEVKRTEIEGKHFLLIKIEHELCNPESKIIWDGSVADSHPPQIFLFLQLLKGDSCEIQNVGKKQTEEFLIDTYELTGDKYTAENAVFRVRNALSKEGKNSDEPVSSND